MITEQEGFSRRSNRELIRMIMEQEGLKYTDVAKLCRVSIHAVNSWMKPQTTKSSYNPPDAAVELLYLKMGATVPPDLDYEPT